MKQPPGFQVEGKDSKLVCKLKRSLYGLKQSPRQWNKRFNSYLQQIVFTRSDFDHCLYFKNLNLSTAGYLLLYVDDMIILSKDKAVIKGLKAKLKQEFEMKELGQIQKILGIEITRNRVDGRLCLKQSNYIQKIIQKFNLQDANNTSVPLGGHFLLSREKCSTNPIDIEEKSKIPYAMALGCLMYIMVSTRPDIAHALSILSRFMSNPRKAY